MAFRCKGPQRLAMVLLGALAALIAVALFVPVMQQVGRGKSCCCVLAVMAGRHAKIEWAC